MATSNTVAAAQTHHCWKFLIREAQIKSTLLCWWTHTWTWGRKQPGFLKGSESSAGPPRELKVPAGAHWSDCFSSAAMPRAFQGDAGGLGTTPGGQLSTSHLAQPWLRWGNEQADKMNPSLPLEGGYFWSVLSNICRLEQGGMQAAQEKACSAVTKLQIKLSTAVS